MKEKIEDIRQEMISQTKTCEASYLKQFNEKAEIIQIRQRQG